MPHPKDANYAELCDYNSNILVLLQKATEIRTATYFQNAFKAALLWRRLAFGLFGEIFAIIDQDVKNPFFQDKTIQLVP
jgi:hypothetical protein